jgi:hypothetical protein
MAEEKKSGEQKPPTTGGRVADEESLETRSLQKGDVLGLEHTDPVLNAKMHLVNDAIDEIGFTTYQVKLFCLNGFGFAQPLHFSNLVVAC